MRGSGLEWAGREDRPGGGCVTTQRNFRKPWGGRGPPAGPLILTPPVLGSGACVDSDLFGTSQFLKAVATGGAVIKEESSWFPWDPSPPLTGVFISCGRTRQGGNVTNTVAHGAGGPKAEAAGLEALGRICLLASSTFWGAPASNCRARGLASPLVPIVILPPSHRDPRDDLGPTSMQALLA